jgi:hypothetical protein
MKILSFAFLFCCLLSETSQASTFVGNGGSTIDIEYTVAEKQVKESLEIIEQTKNDPNNTFCTCPKELEGHPLCESLSSLTDSQRQYCKKSIRENAAALLSAFDRALIHWTNEPITVSESKGPRAAQAVTDSSRSMITLSQESFKSQKDYERIFLLTHELGHLLQWESRWIKDDEPLGPFTSTEGGREFLNSLGAAVAINAYEYGLIDKYEPSLRRSQSRKAHFISLQSDGLKISSDDSFAVKSMTGSALRYIYFFDSDVWGLWANVSGAKGKEQILTQTRITHERNNFALGLSRRFFFIADPLTYFGQSFFTLNLGFESSRHIYSAEDGFLRTETTTNSRQAIVDLTYSLPLVRNFWFDLTIGHRAEQYTIQIDNRSIPYRASNFSQLGVSYAF